MEGKLSKMADNDIDLLTMDTLNAIDGVVGEPIVMMTLADIVTMGRTMSQDGADGNMMVVRLMNNHLNWFLMVVRLMNNHLNWFLMVMSNNLAWFRIMTVRLMDDDLHCGSLLLMMVMIYSRTSIDRSGSYKD